MNNSTFEKLMRDKEDIKILIEGLSTTCAIQSKLLGEIIKEDTELPEHIATYMQEVILIDSVIMELMGKLGLAWGDIIITDLPEELDLSKLQKFNTVQ
jgi:hypothetical protein